LIEAFLQSLERKYDSPGPSLIGKLTTIISLSKAGASRYELENQVGHDSALMAVLQKWWKLPTATKMPPGLLPRITSEFGSTILYESNSDGSTVLRFMNSLFETVILKRYCPSPGDEKTAREEIAVFFSDDTCPVALPRRAVVAVDQMIKLGAFDRAREFIFRKNVFYNYAVQNPQRIWLLDVLRATGGYDGVVEAIRVQLDVAAAGDSTANQDNVSSRAVQCAAAARLFLDMELLADAWSFSCEAVELLESQIPQELLVGAFDIANIESADALKHIAYPKDAPILGPEVTSMPNDWRQCYAETNIVKIMAGSLFYDTLESQPELYKSVATTVLILSRRVVEIWSDNKNCRGYGVALTIAARMSYKQNVIGPVFVDRAIDMLDEALPVLIDACGELSVEVGDAIYWLGEAYHEKAVHTMSIFNRNPKAEEMTIGLSCLFAAERIYKICHGAVHKNVGKVLTTIGAALGKSSRLQASEKYYRMAHKTVEVATGVDSVLTATVLVGLTGILTMQGKIDQQTLDICERVRAVFERTYGKEYERTKNVQKAIDTIKTEMNK